MSFSLRPNIYPKTLLLQFLLETVMLLCVCSKRVWLVKYKRRRQKEIYTCRSDCTHYLFVHTSDKNQFDLLNISQIQRIGKITASFKRRPKIDLNYY